MVFVIKKLNLIVGLLSLVFLAGYILFLSFSNSLDFKIEKSSVIRAESTEEYEEFLAVLAGAQSKDFLVEAGAGLGLVETTLADGYIDIRTGTVSVGDTLVRNQ